MSSILDALRKVEARELRPLRLPAPRPRSRTRLAAIVAATAFAAGAGVVVLLVGQKPTAPPEPVAETDTQVARVMPATEPAMPSPPVPAAAAPTPSAPEAESEVPDQITILTPPRDPGPLPEAKVHVDVPAEVQAEVEVHALPTPVPSAPPIDAVPGPPPGAPQIHVSFLIYSTIPERRQVSLTIDNGALVTLHEGESAGGVSLVRVLPDRIHVEHGGRTFSVRAVL